MLWCQQSELEPKEFIGFAMSPQPYAVFPWFLQHLGLEMKGISQEFWVSAPATTAWESLSLLQCCSQHLSADLRNYCHHFLSLRCTEFNGSPAQTTPTQTHRGGRGGTMTIYPGGGLVSPATYIYIYICMCIYIYIYIRPYVHMIYAYIYIYIRICMYMICR